MSERRLSAAEIDALWAAAWTPAEVARRLAEVTVPCCVTAGWALDLFTDAARRHHSDIEIAVPADQFDRIIDALPVSNGMSPVTAASGRSPGNTPLISKRGSVNRQPGRTDWMCSASRRSLDGGPAAVMYRSRYRTTNSSCATTTGYHTSFPRWHCCSRPSICARKIWPTFERCCLPCILPGVPDFAAGSIVSIPATRGSWSWMRPRSHFRRRQNLPFSPSAIRRSAHAELDKRSSYNPRSPSTSASVAVVTNSRAAAASWSSTVTKASAWSWVNAMYWAW